MTHFSKNIAPYVKAEINKSNLAYQAGQYVDAFSHLENAHVLGQSCTYWHVKVHCMMLLWGIKQFDSKEVVGQLIRVLGAGALTAIKGVPIGNTGGSNVSPVKVMPIKAEHAAIIAIAKGKM